MCSTCLIFLSVCLCLSHPLSHCVCYLLVPFPLLLSQNLWGCGPGCDSVQIQAESYSICICLLLVFSPTCLFPPSLALSCDAASASGSVPLCHCVCLSHPPGPCSGPTVLHFLSCSLFLCLWFLSLFLLGDITEVLEFGTLAVLGSVRAPGCMWAWAHPTLSRSAPLIDPLLLSSGPPSGAPAWCCPCWHSPGCLPSWP